MNTTIKVSDELRDRLKAQAARDGLTMGTHLRRLADLDDRQHRLLSLERAIAEASVGDKLDHQSESDVWERAELADSTS